MPQETQQYLRELGRPQVEAQDNGLHKITRRYVASGASTESLFGDYWGGSPPGPTLDIDYTDACLIQQTLEPSEDNTHQILVAVYQELDPDGNPTEVGRPDYKRDADDLLEVTRTFIARRVTGTPSYLAEGRIGSETFDDALLGKVAVDQGVVFDQIQETYFEKGIISTKYSEKHNGALKMYSIRSIGLESSAEVIEKSGLAVLNDYALIQVLQGSGSTDYEFGGLEVRTWVYAYGAGLVSHAVDDKGPVEITTDKVLLPHTGTYSWSDFSDIPDDKAYEVTTEDKDGYDLVTVRGVVGAGQLHTQTNYQFNEYVTQTRIRNIGDWPATPEGFTEIARVEDKSGNFTVYEKTFIKVQVGVVGRIEEERGQVTITTEVVVTAADAEEPDSSIDDPYHTQRDIRENYALWTFKGAVGEGEYERDTRTRIGDHITQTTIRKIDDWPAPPAGFVEIGSREDNSGTFPIYEKTFLRVTPGAIGLTTEERGEAVITTEVIVADLDAGEPDTTINDPYETSNEDRDGYSVWTFKGVTGDGEIARDVDTRANGAIVVTSIKTIGTAPTSSGDLITDKEYYEGNLKIYHRVYVEGSGTIRTVNEYKENVTVVTTTAVYGSTGSDPSAGVTDVFERIEEEEDGYTVVTWKTVTGSGSYYTEEEELFNGEVTVTTTRHFGTATIPTEAYESGVDTSGDLKVTFWKIASGNGLIATKTEGRMDGFTYTTESYVGSYASTADGYLLSRAVDKKQGYTVTTDVYIDLPTQSTLVLERSDVKGLKYSTYLGLATEPTGAGHPVNKKVNEIRTYDGTTLTTYEYTYVEGQGEYSRTTFTQNGIHRTRIKSIDVQPSMSGCIDSWNYTTHKDADGNESYTEYDVTFISGSGELSRKVTRTGTLLYTSIRYIGSITPPSGGVTERSQETLYDKDGNSCDTVYTETYVSGAGEFSTAEYKDGVRYYHVTRYAATCGEGSWMKVIKMDTDPVFDVTGTQIGCVSKFVSADGTGDVYKETSRVNEHGVTIIRKEAVDYEIPAGVCVLTSSWETKNDIYGNEAYKRVVFDEASGSGDLGQSKVKKGKLTLTTYRSLNVPPSSCSAGNALRTSETEVKGTSGGTCYTLYEYTCSDTESGAVFRSDACSASGLRTVTTRAYNDYAEPVPWAAASDIWVDVEKTLDYDGNGELIYQQRRVYAPSDYTFESSQAHARAGELSMDSQANLTVVKQPVSGVINTEVQVSYHNTGLSDEEVEEIKAHPVLTENLTLPSGSIIRNRHVYHSFKVADDSETYGTKTNEKIDGIIVSKAERWLTAHDTNVGTVGLISITNRRIFSCGGSSIYEKVLVYDQDATS
tara:strand:- start:859 stop:4854 length:3996 start_codon:yes stop_codon:yes gene_type:complete